MRVHTLQVARHAVALAALACTMGAEGAIATSGDVGTSPSPVGLGPGNTALPDTVAFVGAVWAGPTGVGTLTVDGGSFLQLAKLSFGHVGGSGTGYLSGTGSRVELVGVGAQPNPWERLFIGDGGNGSLIVSAGAYFESKRDIADCLLPLHSCNSFVGHGAGYDGTLTVTGTGSQASLGHTLFVAQPYVNIQNNLVNYGVLGGTTRGTVNVANGAQLQTDRAEIAPRHWSTWATGRERNIGEVNVDGAGSRWVVAGGKVLLDPVTGAVGEGSASIITANDRNAWATLNISGGGVLEMQGQSSVYNFINLTAGGGRTDMLVTGAGSRLMFSGLNGILQVGRSLGTAQLSVVDGGVIEGLYYLSVGRDGSNGNLLINGTGSAVRVNGTATSSANGISSTGFIDIGRNGSGTVTVSGGGQLLLDASQALQGGTGMNLGRDASSSGTLNIDGAGSVVRIDAVSVLPSGGVGESLNPIVRVGRDGTGVLNVTGGGKLLMEGGAVSTSANRRSTSLFIGGSSDAAVGGKGVATVTGAGSEIRVTGTDTFVGVGVGPQAVGQLTVSNQALVSANGINVGRSGGVGVLKVDAATLAFSGQQTGGNLAGAFFSVGNGGGIGVATLANGSLVTLTNMGSSGAGVSVGGSGNFANGEGSLTLQGASRIELHSQPGLNTVTVGREGSGFLRLRGASSIDQGTGVLQVARNSGSDGTVILSEDSSITAGWVGIGARKTDTGDTDGGTGTFVLINSTLTADQIVIGTNGFLGGTGTINGTVTNRGIFAPGNSPGRLEINGGFLAEAGSRLILEVESDGNGGFKTDELVFNAGEPLNLAGLNIEFRFLGDTNPVEFNESGQFGTDTFFQVKGTDGSLGVLDDSVFSDVGFEASAETFTISSFSFSAADGASNFTATPVPEPGTSAMLLAGLAGLGWLARRRRAA